MYATAKKNCSKTALRKEAMDEILFEKIERYLQGMLTPAERERFETEMKEDAALREEVALHKQLMSSIETESVRQLLEQIHEGNFERETPVVSIRHRRSYTFIAVAASLALLILSGWWYINSQVSQPASLYAAYFSPAAGLPTTLSYTNDARFSEGMISYKLGAYAEAREWWQPLLQADPANDTLNFYMGVAALADEQTDGAINYLSKVVEENNSIYYADARWYLALAYLLDENKEKVKTILQDLSEEDGTYREQSIEIIKKITSDG